MRQNPDFVDQNDQRRYERVAARIMACAEAIAREGSLVATWRWHGGHKLGPYWRVAFRDRGRQKSIYLGRSEPLLHEVRQLLEELKRAERQRKDWARLHAEARTELRRQKALWERELRARGLYTRGYAIRGVRRFARAMGAAARVL